MINSMGPRVKEPALMSLGKGETQRSNLYE
jgi:hypothetical protein